MSVREKLEQREKQYLKEREVIDEQIRKAIAEDIAE